MLTTEATEVKPLQQALRMETTTTEYDSNVLDDLKS